MSAQPAPALRIVRADDAPQPDQSSTPAPGVEPLYWDRTPRLAREVLTDAACKLLGAIEGQCRPGERVCKADNPTLAQACGWGTNLTKVKTGLRELRANGWVRRDGTKNHRLLVLAYDLAGRPQAAQSTSSPPITRTSARTGSRPCKGRITPLQGPDSDLPLFNREVRPSESAHARMDAVGQSDARTDGVINPPEPESATPAVEVTELVASGDPAAELAAGSGAATLATPPPSSEDVAAALTRIAADPRNPLRKLARARLEAFERGEPEPQDPPPPRSSAPLSQGNPRRKRAEPPDPEREAIVRAQAAGSTAEVLDRVAAYLGEPNNPDTRAWLAAHVPGLPADRLGELLRGVRDSARPGRLFVWRLKRLGARAPT